MALELQLAVKTVRNLRNIVSINVNRARGREFIPAHRKGFNIETSALCNLDCVFCAYPKKQSPKITMPDALFEDAVRQALDLGYEEFDLTPCTGDIFMDRGVFNKLEFLDRTPGVTGYGFYTNFTVPRPQDIERLVRLKKLGGFGISIYGHDLTTFKLITKANEKLYHRLVENLELLFTLRKQREFPLHFAIHPGARSLRGRSSEVLDVIAKFKTLGVTTKTTKGVYNNWGGYVTPEDVKGMPITVGAPTMIYKKGACSRIFTSVQVMATGIVNGCAARDTDATLQLGDLRDKPLRDILSDANPVYMNLIDAQQRGDFPAVCKSCDFYTSINHKSSNYKREGTVTQSIAEFKQSIHRG
jgi:hypothetical protein